ncbi:hypothetical protein [Stratiformator vulcanicus]|uniref:Uncharacterized protein n=1 Tax=Stratiformator vulcanicus TaxID=2527980 RepID=A0A517QZ10_9PLAN|nr:hypothetical protein [Stratiformator vulcanicus]QDT36833.1 hypothetical protein Pan189_11960 [Stratiformator vulcanicus]
MPHFIRPYFIAAVYGLLVGLAWIGLMLAPSLGLLPDFDGPQLPFAILGGIAGTVAVAASMRMSAFWWLRVIFSCAICAAAGYGIAEALMEWSNYLPSFGTNWAKVAGIFCGPPITVTLGLIVMVATLGAPSARPVTPLKRLAFLGLAVIAGFGAAGHIIGSVMVIEKFSASTVMAPVVIIGSILLIPIYALLPMGYLRALRVGSAGGDLPDHANGGGRDADVG